MNSTTKLKDICSWLSLPVPAGQGELPIRSVSTDSRSVGPGELFLALKGESFDGHAYIGQAMEKGAAAVISEKPVSGNVPVLVVPDSLKALVALGQGVRRQFRGPVIGVTGSAGKSSTKEMIAKLLGPGTTASPASFNNLIGVSKTLLLVNESTQRLVLEMGMNAFGEIAELCQHFQPTLGLITNIGDAHVGKLGGIEGVYKAKKELFDYLARHQGAVALNLRDERVKRAYVEAFTVPGRRLTYSSLPDKSADVSIEQVRLDSTSAHLKVSIRIETELHTVELPMFGVHHAENMAAAVAAARLVEIPASEIINRLSQIRPAHRRGEIHRLAGDRLLIDESYNSNPTALKSAIQSLALLDSHRRTLLVVGDMLELEGFSESLHREVGKFIAQTFASRPKSLQVIGVGKQSAYLLEEVQAGGIATTGYDDAVKAASKLQTGVKEGDTVLIKSSRGGRLDRIVDALLQKFPPA